MKNKITKEIVYSNIPDKNIKKDITNSPIWKNCLHSNDEGCNKMKYRYYIKFDGLKPIQVTNVKGK